MASSFVQLGTELRQIIIPIIMFFGILGNSLNIIVLTRPALYKHACSRYLLVLGCTNLFSASVVLIFRLLSDGYQLDLTRTSVVLCKTVSFFSQTSAISSSYMIVVTSFDRFCASSTSIRLRAYSNVTVSRWVILFVLTVIELFHLNTLILTDLRTTDTLYKQVFIVMQIFIYTVIAPALMAIFGALTIYNIKKTRVAPVVGARHRRTETQLASMLILQVSTNILLAAPAGFASLITVMPNTFSTTVQFFLAWVILQLFLYASFTTPIVMYIISASIYRKELIRLFYKVFYPAGNAHANILTNQVTPMHS